MTNIANWKIPEINGPSIPWRTVSHNQVGFYTYWPEAVNLPKWANIVILPKHLDNSGYGPPLDRRPNPMSNDVSRTWCQSNASRWCRAWWVGNWSSDPCRIRDWWATPMDRMMQWWRRHRWPKVGGWRRRWPDGTRDVQILVGQISICLEQQFLVVFQYEEKIW